MPVRNFMTRDSIKEEDAIVDAVAGRENELASYDANIESYTRQLVALDAALPAEWPPNLAPFRGKSNEQIFAIGGSKEDMLLASQMNHRERVRMLLFTENAEMRKSEQAYAQHKALLPTDATKRQAAIERYKTKQAAIENKVV